MKRVIAELKLHNAFNLSQKSENVIGIWWYQIRTGILEYLPDAKGHLDSRFELRKLAASDTSIIRGRLIKIDRIIYNVSFISNLTNIKTSILLDLENKLEISSKHSIDFMIDDEGNLTENKRG